ncbi:MAG TPA: FAD-binding protein, partial [Pyrinomonadaceae bacterium]
YLHTTNPSVATGDGMAMAYRAGAELSDMEFVQFHPTALSLEGAPRFLLSEALRGEGGVLRNAAGRRFMPRYHDAAELAPRDVVTRSIVAEMGRTATRAVFLDMTAFDAAHLRRRFPKIYRTCLEYGLDLAGEPIPVSPAAHYCMGGVRTDLEGRTTLPGLYAAGEVACTGVHGANRLASNSLLEGLVFGARAGLAAAEDLKGLKSSADVGEDVEASGEPARADVGRVSVASAAVRKRVRRLMWERVGILRAREGLLRALSEFEQIAAAPLLAGPRNFVTTASVIARSALWREESRGGHYRLDFPRRDDARWRVHSVIQKDAGLTAAESVEFAAGVES